MRVEVGTIFRPIFNSNINQFVEENFILMKLNAMSEVTEVIKDVADDDKRPSQEETSGMQLLDLPNEVSSDIRHLPT